jgi:hypothetical protein
LFFFRLFLHPVSLKNKIVRLYSHPGKTHLVCTNESYNKYACISNENEKS